MAWAMLLTLTRGAWIGACVALGVIVARWRLRWVLVVPVLAAAALLLLPATYRQRALLTFDPTYFSNADRVQMWKAGLAMWRAHPWTGVCLGDLKPIYREFAGADVPRIPVHVVPLRSRPAPRSFSPELLGRPLSFRCRSPAPPRQRGHGDSVPPTRSRRS